MDESGRLFDVSAAGDLTVAIGQVGGVVTAFDVVESHTATLVVDISCNALNEGHGREITDAATLDRLRSLALYPWADGRRDHCDRRVHVDHRPDVADRRRHRPARARRRRL